MAVVASAAAPAEAAVASAPGPAALGAVAAAAPAAGGTVRLQTPVLSVRRLPGLLARTVAMLRLEPTLDAAFAAAGPDACLIVQQGSVVLFSRRPTLPLIPASNLKLLTVAAALDRMGPDAKLVTDVRADHPAAGGTVNGNLYLVGGGDPLLRTADYVASLRYHEEIYSHLDRLAQQVHAAGVTHVAGGVVGDESRYDTQRSIPTWKPSYAATGEVGPLSALEVNDGFDTFRPNDVAAAQPAVQAARVFTDLLRQRGVAVDGAPAQGRTPAAAAPITSLSSPPLADTLAEVLRQSGNNGAELITKELGRRFGGAPTTAAGMAVIRGDLQASGLPVDQLTMLDGSGLDRGDRATCQLVIDALTRRGLQSDLVKGLPVAGRSGTLEKRFIGTPAAGRLRAKTGSLTGVTALSGVVDPAPGSSDSGLAFALILNGQPSMTAGETLADRIGVILAGYPQAPSADRLAPLPALASP
jgi:serine-type D-Ala-D-Ala carboxypeptidase/endopeptidase (penicillin-binding protein 4)